VEVRSGRTPAGPDIADHIAAVDMLSTAHRKAGKVAVAGADPVAVVNHDRFTIAAQIVGKRHNPVGWRHDRMSVIAADIHAAVERAFPVERINPLAEAARNLTFHWPKVGSRVRFEPVRGSRVTCQAERQPHHGGSRQRRRA
jgi:hypothetical protein